MKFLLTGILALCILAACNNEKKEETKVPAEPVAASAPPAAPPPGIEMKPALDGSWELDYISGLKITFKGLYPNNVPVISFDTDSSRVSGNTSCNNFSGKLNTDGNKISFNEAMAMTKMFCPGQGETIFLETLKKINTYSVNDSSLTLIMGDIALMRFNRK